jgi:hypothetical protein
VNYRVGDLVFIEKCRPFSRITPRFPSHLSDINTKRIKPFLVDSFIIITEIVDPKYAWDFNATEEDTIYILFSQKDLKQYWFCEEDIKGKLIK